MTIFTVGGLVWSKSKLRRYKKAEIFLNRQREACWFSVWGAWVVCTCLYSTASINLVSTRAILRRVLTARVTHLIIQFNSIPRTHISIVYIYIIYVVREEGEEEIQTVQLV